MQIMRGILTALIVLAVAACSSSDQPAEEMETAAVIEKGEPITITDVTSIDSMMANPDQYLNKHVRIEGEVMGRCEGSGCWISLDRGEESEGLIVQAADRSFIFPEDCVGKRVVVQGALMLHNPEEIAEHEHEMGEGEEKDHTCPNPEYFFAPEGLKVTS
ncbi:MAG: hypothetical protein MAG453_01772 [Calditrichaeota bacterium]|nr:hypothetical protein [Calditrichota bacterium]